MVCVGATWLTRHVACRLTQRIFGLNGGLRPAMGIVPRPRRKPDPRGQPGYLRLDTVHQGNHDGKPGLHHINAVDTVTQWQVVGCVETISERHLVPVLEAILHQFRFRILGFHCDNGSEFLNHTGAKLLNKLLVEFTKSRPYRTTDNALVEGKNGAVVRKHIGYGHIGAEHAQALQKFYMQWFNPCLNYHDIELLSLIASVILAVGLIPIGRRILASPGDAVSK